MMPKCPPQLVFLLGLSAAAAVLGGCEAEPVSIQVHPAALVVDPQTAPDPGWNLVDFDGSARTPEAFYQVRAEPLFGERHIVALQARPQADGSFAIDLRFDDYARRRIEEFGSRFPYLKKPLAIKVNGRWVDFIPQPGESGDPMTLYGFDEAEVAALQRYLENR